jgi:hypothetical protein
MSCILKLFRKQSKPKPPQQQDLRIITPLDLDELPDNLLSCRALEAAHVDILVSLHYQIEEINRKIRTNIDNHPTEDYRQLLGKRYMLTEKKKVFVRRLEKVQEKIDELKQKHEQ